MLLDLEQQTAIADLQQTGSLPAVPATVSQRLLDRLNFRPASQAPQREAVTIVRNGGLLGLSLYLRLMLCLVNDDLNGFSGYVFHQSLSRVFFATVDRDVFRVVQGFRTASRTGLRQLLNTTALSFGCNYLQLRPVSHISDPKVSRTPLRRYGFTVPNLVVETPMTPWRGSTQPEVGPLLQST